MHVEILNDCCSAKRHNSWLTNDEDRDSIFQGGGQMSWGQMCEMGRVVCRWVSAIRRPISCTRRPSLIIARLWSMDSVVSSQSLVSVVIVLPLLLRRPTNVDRRRSSTNYYVAKPNNNRRAALDAFAMTPTVVCKLIILVTVRTETG